MFAGIGYVMTGQQEVVGVDLDHCVEGGVVAPWAAEVVAQLDSYAEISPSGTGLRVMVRGEVPSDWVNHEIGIEIYGGNEARFLTITGNTWRARRRTCARRARACSRHWKAATPRSGARPT
jgi:putative DNA primase/helicase